MRWQTFFLVLFLCISADAISQVYLLIDKEGTSKRWRYFKGDEIKVKLAEEGKKTARITGFSFNDSLIYLNKVAYKLQDIKKVYHIHYWWNLLSRTTTVAGIGYFAIYTINDGISTSFAEAERVLLPAGILLATGILLRPVAQKPLSKRRYRMRIFNSNPK